jgi:tetratricopeptide (TPR) repeat protein|tara:strand:- start:6258 stop:7964 length:1707 start_codon:yes stop_codon:yes gene_type:complete
MKNLKVQFKLIIFFLLFLNIFNSLSAKNIDKFSNSKDLSNYFSGIMAINDNQYKTSYRYFKSLNNLEESHYSYSQYYLYSLIALKKFKDSANYSIKLKEKNLDNFESNLVSGIYYLKNNDFAQAKLYFKRLKNQNHPGNIQNLLSKSLNIWTDFEDIQDINLALSSLNAFPDKFENMRSIQEVFVYCYFDSDKTDETFKKLTTNPKVNYSRYYFFHANYLISKDRVENAKNILKSSLDLHPESLILNQLNTSVEKEQKNNDKFDCKENKDVIAEILYIVANGLASQTNYTASNFYLNLAKYLNPSFLSFDLLYAENLNELKQYAEALKIYNKTKKIGSDYSWHSSKRITSILKKQEKKKEAIKYLGDSFLEIKNPDIYEIFDYADFLKNNEYYKESIKYYSELINLIDKKHNLYGEILDGRGVAYERTDQWNKAEIDLLNSLKNSPNDAYVINYLAYSWIEKGINIEKSLKMLKKANELKPNDGYIIDSLGWALFKLKKYNEAKKYLEEAVSLMTSDPVINDHYADSLWMNNNTVQARYYWNYVLKLKKTEKKLKKEIEQKLLFGLKT